MAISTGTALVAGAVIGGAAGILGSSEAASASEAAAASMAQAQLWSTEMQLQFLREIRADLAEAVDLGILDLDTAMQSAIATIQGAGPGLTAYGAGYDPIQEYIRLLESPGTELTRPSAQYMYNQGLEALQAAYSKTAGGGLSGRAVKAAQEYGQNYAANQLDKELARIAELIPIQTGIANLQAGAGASKANIRLQGAQGAGNITAASLPSIAAGVANQGYFSAFNQLNQGNIATNLYSNIGNQASDLLYLIATRPDLFSSTSPDLDL